MKNKKAKQMICDSQKSQWSDFDLHRAYWKHGESLQVCGNWKGRGFSRFYVYHGNKISLTADQLRKSHGHIHKSATTNQ